MWRKEIRYHCSEGLKVNAWVAFRERMEAGARGSQTA